MSLLPIIDAIGTAIGEEGYGGVCHVITGGGYSKSPDLRWRTECYVDPHSEWVSSEGETSR